MAWNGRTKNTRALPPCIGGEPSGEPSSADMEPHWAMRGVRFLWITWYPAAASPADRRQISRSHRCGRIVQWRITVSESSHVSTSLTKEVGGWQLVCLRRWEWRRSAWSWRVRGWSPEVHVGVASVPSGPIRTIRACSPFLECCIPADFSSDSSSETSLSMTTFSLLPSSRKEFQSRAFRCSWRTRSTK